MIKLVGAFFLTGFAMTSASLVSAGAYLMTGGVAMCQVRTPEVDLTIPFPTRFADAAMIVGKVALPSEELDDVRAEIEPYLPMIEEVLDELARIPDGTQLVSVQSGEETVRVERRRGRFHVDVKAPDADVHVSIPARSLRRLGRNALAML